MELVDSGELSTSIMERDQLQPAFAPASADKDELCVVLKERNDLALRCKQLAAEVERLTHNYRLLNEELALRDSRDAEVIRMAEEIQLLRTQQAVEVSMNYKLRKGSYIKTQKGRFYHIIRGFTPSWIAAWIYLECGKSRLLDTRATPLIEDVVPSGETVCKQCARRVAQRKDKEGQ